MFVVVVVFFCLLLFVFLWNVCECTKPNLAMLRAPEYSVVGADLGRQSCHEQAAAERSSSKMQC